MSTGQQKEDKADPEHLPGPELVIITGLSGSGKGTVLRVFEDLGFFSVDNLPIELIPKFAQLAQDSSSIAQAALVVDIREGEALRTFNEALAMSRASAGRPSELQSLLYRGETLFRLARYADAEEDFRSADSAATHGLLR